MKIEKVENKEKPEYDTKSEKQNKFLKLIFEHKILTTTLVIVLILTFILLSSTIKIINEPNEVIGLLPVSDINLEEY